MTSHIATLRRLPHIRLIPMLWTLALGLWGLSRQDSVWRDEAATWQVAQRSTGDIVRMLGNVDVVRGLYYLFMPGLFECFGPGITVLRLPSCTNLTIRRLAPLLGVSPATVRGGIQRPRALLAIEPARRPRGRGRAVVDRGRHPDPGPRPAGRRLLTRPPLLGTRAGHHRRQHPAGRRSFPMRHRPPFVRLSGVAVGRSCVRDLSMREGRLPPDSAITARPEAGFQLTVDGAYPV